MSEPTFTKEQLEKIERLARAFGHEPAVMGDELANVAVFALRLMADNNSLRRHKIQLGEERAAEWKRAEKAEAERDELQATYDLFSDAWRRADAIWVAQDPEQRSRRRPGLAEQIVWLVTELEKAEAERDEARRELAILIDVIRDSYQLGLEEGSVYALETDMETKCDWPKHPERLAAVRRALERKP